MKANSFDKKFTFTDALGTIDTFFATSSIDAARQYRGRLAHIDGLGVDRALAVIKTSIMKDEYGIIKASGETII